VPPFTIQDDTDGGDDLRMRYRYLDLRRNAVKKNLELRYAVNRAARNYLHARALWILKRRSDQVNAGRCP
jgi:aspartyl-tRNA synthetase